MVQIPFSPPSQCAVTQKEAIERRCDAGFRAQQKVEPFPSYPHCVSRGAGREGPQFTAGRHRVSEWRSLVLYHMASHGWDVQVTGSPPSLAVLGALAV